MSKLTFMASLNSNNKSHKGIEKSYSLSYMEENMVNEEEEVEWNISFPLNSLYSRQSRFQWDKIILTHELLPGILSQAILINTLNEGYSIFGRWKRLFYIWISLFFFLEHNSHYFRVLNNRRMSISFGNFNVLYVSLFRYLLRKLFLVTSQFPEEFLSWPKVLIYASNLLTG